MGTINPQYNKPAPSLVYDSSLFTKVWEHKRSQVIAVLTDNAQTLKEIASKAGLGIVQASAILKFMAGRSAVIEGYQRSPTARSCVYTYRLPCKPTTPADQP